MKDAPCEHDFEEPVYEDLRTPAAYAEVRFGAYVGCKKCFTVLSIRYAMPQWLYRLALEKYSIGTLNERLSEFMLAKMRYEIAMILEHRAEATHD